MGLHGVPEFSDQGMLLERLLDDAALDAFAAAVNQPDLTEARLVCGADVLLDHGGDVARRERVQVDLIVDRNAVRHRGTYSGAG